METIEENYIPVNVVVEVVVRRVHDDGAEAHVEREEALSNGCVPNLKKTKPVILEDKSLRILVVFTSASRSLSHWGRTKYKMPSPAPSRVAALISSAPMTTYGNSARKYENFPDVCTPLRETKNTTTHEARRHKVNLHSGRPTPSLMFSFSFKTSSLKKKQRRYIPNKISVFWFLT